MPACVVERISTKSGSSKRRLLKFAPESSSALAREHLSGQRQRTRHSTVAPPQWSLSPTLPDCCRNQEVQTSLLLSFLQNQKSCLRRGLGFQDKLAPGDWQVPTHMAATTIKAARMAELLAREETSNMAAPHRPTHGEKKKG